MTLLSPKNPALVIPLHCIMNLISYCISSSRILPNNTNKVKTLQHLNYQHFRKNLKSLRIQKKKK